MTIEPQQNWYTDMSKDVERRDLDPMQAIMLNNSRFVKLVQWIGFSVLASTYTCLAAKGFSSSNYFILGINAILLYAYLAFDIVACILGRYSVVKSMANGNSTVETGIPRAKLMREIASKPNLQKQLAMYTNSFGDSGLYIRKLRLAKVGLAMATVHVLAILTALWLRNPVYSFPEVFTCLLLAMFVLVYTSRIVLTRVDIEHESVKTLAHTIKLPIPNEKRWCLGFDPLMRREYYCVQMDNNSYKIYDPAFNPSFILRALMGKSGRESEIR